MCPLKSHVVQAALVFQLLFNEFHLNVIPLVKLNVKLRNMDRKVVGQHDYERRFLLRLFRPILLLRLMDYRLHSPIRHSTPFHFISSGGDSSDP